MMTLWGETDSARALAPGILDVRTPSHGGIVLDETHAQRMKTSGHVPYKGDWRYWEEDTDWQFAFQMFAEEIRQHITAEEFDRISACVYRKL